MNLYHIYRYDFSLCFLHELLMSFLKYDSIKKTVQNFHRDGGNKLSGTVRKIQKDGCS